MNRSRMEESSQQDLVYPAWRIWQLEFWIKHLSEKALPSQKCSGRTQSCTCCAGGKDDQRNPPMSSSFLIAGMLCSCVYSNSAFCGLQNLAFSQPQPALGWLPWFLTSHYLFYAIYSSAAGEHWCASLFYLHFEEWLWFLFTFMVVQEVVWHHVHFSIQAPFACIYHIASSSFVFLSPAISDSLCPPAFH